MAMRSPAGFISSFYDPLKNPDAPTGITGTAGDASVTVAFTPPANVGGSAITAYYTIANNGTTATATSSPIAVTGLTNGTAYTFNVWAVNSYGDGVWSSASGSVSPFSPRGLFAGGIGPSNNIQYITIATTGNATFFGFLTVSRRYMGGCGSSSRGVILGGSQANSDNKTIDYVTYATTGNATSFGLLLNASEGACSSSNSTIGLHFLGWDGSVKNKIQYVTIATSGNSTTFGTIGVGTEGSGACGSSTRAVHFAGYSINAYVNYVNTVLYSTVGNSTGWGNLITARSATTACSSPTRAIISGGTTGSAISSIEYFTISTNSTATGFGNLSATKAELASCSSPTRAVIAGGYNGSYLNVIEYVTIATAGNATSFGLLTAGISQLAGFSSSHGGL